MNVPTNRVPDAPARVLVDVPTYDRGRLVPAVVHLGAGSFHRAHQAVYFDELAARGHHGWGVVGVGVRRPELCRVLEEQDNLFVVVQRGSDADTARVVGSVVDYLLLAEERDAVVARLADQRIRLVTLTVTGEGYRQNADTGVFPALVDALELRRSRRIPPFTVLSCDNLPDNGAAAREATLTAARRRSAELAEWIQGAVCFPSSMVDRITPATTPETRDAIEAQFHVHDRWPVVTEPFAQWVIEDRFCHDRPPLDLVGAQFVRDVAPYKLIKNRMLNGTHSALGYLGALAGYRTTAEAMAQPSIARAVRQLMQVEIEPGLPRDVDGMELEPYAEVLLDRLANRAIADDLSRLCRRGSTKMRDYVLPSLHVAAAADRDTPLLCLAVAAWCRYLQGCDDTGRAIDVDDPRAEEMQALARTGVAALLADTDVFGELGRDPRLVDRVTTVHRALARQGVIATIEELLHER